MESYRQNIRLEQDAIEKSKSQKIEFNLKIDNEILDREKKIKHYRALLQKAKKGG